MEKRLDHGRGYVSDALRGEKKLSVETILEVLDVIGMPPEEFFEGRVPSRRKRRPPEPPKRSALAASTHSALSDASPILRALLLVLAKKGVLTPDEERDIWRELRLDKGA